jgi:hypothetical protein
MTHDDDDDDDDDDLPGTNSLSQRGQWELLKCAFTTR